MPDMGGNKNGYTYSTVEQETDLHLRKKIKRHDRWRGLRMGHEARGP